MHDLTKAFLALISYCLECEGFDQKHFAMVAKNYVKRWDRLSGEDQGRVCEEIFSELHNKRLFLSL